MGNNNYKAEGLPDGSEKPGEDLCRVFVPDLQQTAGTKDDSNMGAESPKSKKHVTVYLWECCILNTQSQLYHYIRTLYNRTPGFTFFFPQEALPRSSTAP